MKAKPPYNNNFFPIPYIVERILPPPQLSHIKRYYGVFAVAVSRLESTLLLMPRIGDTAPMQNPPAYLHYFTGNADYYLCEFDGKDTFFGKVRYANYRPEYRKLSLASLKSNQFIQLDFSWTGF